VAPHALLPAAAPLWVAAHYLPRHFQWRYKSIGRATANGAAKKGYCDEIFSAMVYFLKWFQVWVNCV
jgi:hypothetical protein